MNKDENKPDAVPLPTKEFVGWLAEYYPGHCFYANNFAKEWDFRLPDGTSDSPHETHATTALLSVAIAAGKNITAIGGSATASFTQVTDSGRDIGSFRVTVERIEHPSADTAPELENQSQEVVR